ncbi:MAG: hypothetical protein Q4B54_06965 [Coriobacteriales bacterium]|nr:hypothetical protein [Coriobacteriales bacterium]
MLRPSIHAHPDRTIIGASLVLLKHMEKRRVCGFDELLDRLEDKVEGSKDLFLPALDLLFLLGAVEYHPQNDSFELVGTR